MSKSTQFVVCYSDAKTDELGWSIVRNISMDKWIADNPDKTLCLWFRKESDQYERRVNQAQHFLNHAMDYGIHPDYLNEIIVINGRAQRIIGLCTKNTKYKVITEDVLTKITYKNAPRLILDCIREKEKQTI